MAECVQKPSFDLTGKTAIVTGGTKGIGYAIAASYAMYGCNVVITSRKAEDCAARAAEINALGGGKCLGVAADSGKSADVDRVIEETLRAFGEIHILVNNAGVGGVTAYLLDQTEENFDYIINANLKGVFLFAQKVAKVMVEQGKGGKIINIASQGGLVGVNGIGIYAASKAGVISFTKSMAMEWSRYGITTNAICPSYVVTDMNREFIMGDPKVKEKMLAKIPLRRYGTVEEIAGPCLAMASDCFNFMNGAYLLLDGGQTAGK